jgi:hypothetical protein
MISIKQFAKTELKLLHLAKLWNTAEGNAMIYESMFVSNPHELATLIGSNTTYSDWQEFLSDSRVQEYIDKVIYTQAGIIINRYFKEGTHLSQADSARLNTAIKYRDDHKADFAVPVQYIYCAVPLTPAERAFLPKDENGGEIL